MGGQEAYVSVLRCDDDFLVIALRNKSFSTLQFCSIPEFI